MGGAVGRKGERAAEKDAQDVSASEIDLRGYQAYVLKTSVVRAYSFRVLRVCSEKCPNVPGTHIESLINSSEKD